MPGTVALDERCVTVVATRSDALVDRVENVTTGDRVRKDQPLVHVYSPAINAAAAQLIADAGFEGARRRLQNLNVSERVIDEMERTRKVPMAITWTSPRDGVVLQRTAVAGMKASAGDILFRLFFVARSPSARRPDSRSSGSTDALPLSPVQGGRGALPARVPVQAGL